MAKEIDNELEKVIKPVQESLVESENIQSVAEVLKANDVKFELFKDGKGRILGVIAAAEALTFAFSTIVLKLGPTEAACLTVFTSPVTMPGAMAGLTAFMGVRKTHV